MVEIEEDEEANFQQLYSQGKSNSGKNSISTSKAVQKKSRQKGPTDKFVMLPSRKAVQLRKMQQTTSKDAI